MRALLRLYRRWRCDRAIRRLEALVRVQGGLGCPDRMRRAWAQDLNDLYRAREAL